MRVRKEDLEAVRALLLADAQAVLGDAISIEEVVSEEGEPDLTLAVEDLSLELLQKWEDAKEQLEPFGPDFAPPRVELTATVSRLYGMRGKDGQERHAKFLPDRAAADGCRVEILWWNRIDEARAVLQKKTGLRVIGRPEEHIYNGIRSIQFVIQEVR